MAAADVGPGRFSLGGEEVHVSEDLRVAKPGQPNLAGSALTLDRAILNVSTHCEVPFPEAWVLASENPAALLGLPRPPEISVSISASGFVCAK
jgi:N-acetylglucosamine-6-phosphate deacetylase